MAVGRSASFLWLFYTYFLAVDFLRRGVSSPVLFRQILPRTHARAAPGCRSHRKLGRGGVRESGKKKKGKRKRRKGPESPLNGGRVLLGEGIRRRRSSPQASLNLRCDRASQCRFPHCNQTTIRFDGTEFRSCRRPKLHVVKPDGTLHACTGVGHAAVVLSGILGGERVLHGQITRRSAKLKERLEEKRVALKWDHERWPDLILPPARPSGFHGDT